MTLAWERYGKGASHSFCDDDCMICCHFTLKEFPEVYGIQKISCALLEHLWSSPVRFINPFFLKCTTTWKSHTIQTEAVLEIAVEYPLRTLTVKSALLNLIHYARRRLSYIWNRTALNVSEMLYIWLIWWKWG